MISYDVFTRVRKGVCGIAISSTPIWGANGLIRMDLSPIDLNVIGTGFAVGDRVILTNRHVRDALPSGRANVHDFTAAFFIDLDDNGDPFFTYYRLGMAVCLGSKENINDIGCKTLGTDLSIYEIDGRCPSIPKESQLSFCKRKDIKIGHHIGVCGYIHGNSLFGSPDDATTLRISPLLLQGHIAGIAPFDNIEGVPLSLLVTDITNGGGLSGSPLFNENGNIIGIHCAGQTVEVLTPYADASGRQFVAHVTQGLGFAVPLYEEFTSTLIASALDQIAAHK